MAKIKVHAGDFYNGEHNYSFGNFSLRNENNRWLGETIPASEIDEIDKASEESIKKIGGTIGWGATGAVLLGPAGLLAGLLLGGRKKEVTFAAKFKDGRKILATTDQKTYTNILSKCF